MNFLYCFDKNYNIQALVSIYSLLENITEKINIHIIHNQGTDDERRYERIPVTMEGDIIHYQLKEIHKQGSRGGGLIALGIAIIVGDFIYDRLKGFQLIEEKRNKVRYKYGQQIKFTYKPNFY